MLQGVRRPGWAALFWVVMTTTAFGAEAAKARPEETVALVNGSAITRGVLQANLDRMLNNLHQRGQNPDPTQLEQLRKRALQGVIDEELLYQESRKVGVKVSAKSVEEQMEAFRGQFENETLYREAMAEMGLTEELLRAQMEKSLAIQGLVQKRVTGGVAVTEAETRAFYDAHPELFGTPELVRVSHILIRVEDAADEAGKMAARKRIAEIRQQLVTGKDFAELAARQSQDPSAVKGGDLGFIRAGQMPPAFEKEAFALPVGQVSQMVFTPLGYHLLKVTDRRAAAVAGFKEVEPRIAKQIKQDKVNAEVKSYIEKLRSKADIQIL